MSPLSRLILRTCMSAGPHPLRVADVLRELGLRKNQLTEFRTALAELFEQGRLVQDEDGTLHLPAARVNVTGKIRKAPGGFGFLIRHPDASTPPDSPPPDIYIAAEDLSDAQSGDEAEVEIVRQHGRFGLPVGRVKQVLQRATHTFVGAYFERGKRGFVQINGNVITEPVAVGDPGAKGVRPGDQVVVEMVRFPTARRPGEAVLTRVLGARGEAGVDTQGIIYEFGLPLEFPEEVLGEARQRSDEFHDTQLEDRLDLTRETIVTIDPADARDFDDAISLSRSEDGHWQLGVHIADVAHFVTLNSALDREARQRATSVYLPDLVIPMLPEILSNGLASLQQGQVRYTVSVLMELTAEGVPVHTEFHRSAIQVTRRFAYEEVFAFFTDPQFPADTLEPPVRELLLQMRKLAKILRGRRFAQGALELDLPEIKIDLNADGKVVGAHQRVHDESHQLIEEFMLAANLAVARELEDRGLLFIRRSHADPDEFKMRKFAEFVNSLGHELPRFQSRTDIQTLLKKVADTPLRQAVNYALLRSMKQAAYTVEPGGHYALAAEDYCHFTSPIRRYPDLTVHRLVCSLTKRRGKAKSEQDAAGLQALAEHCSAMERRAESAERELIKVKLLTYMESQIGVELQTIITGVRDFGLFCQGIEIPAEGLLHVSELAGDFYDYSEATHNLVGRRSGREFRLGQKLKVVVAHVDVARRLLDFRLAESDRKGMPKSAETVESSRGSTSRRGPRQAEAGTESRERPASSRRERSASRKKPVTPARRGNRTAAGEAESPRRGKDQKRSSTSKTSQRKSTRRK